MPQYLLLIHDRPDAWAKLDEAATGALMQEYQTFTQDLVARGVMRSGAPLAQGGSVVRVRDGASTVEAAPYASGSEHTNGFYIVEVDDAAEAAEIAAGIPSARFGTIEVREFGAM